MSKEKIILERVKEFFNDLVNPSAAPVPAVPVSAAAPSVTTTDYELKIGGTVTIDKLEKGGIVTIDGNTAMAGELELADGTMLTIGDNGVIMDMKAPTMNPPMEGTDMNAKFSAFELSTSEKFSSYEIKFSEYEQKFADYEKKMSKANKVIEELLKLSQLIVDAPITSKDSVVRTTNSFKEKKEANLDILFN